MILEHAETDPTFRRIYVYLVTSAREPVTGYTPSSGELRVSKSGATLADGAGSWVELADGHYYYQATQTELTTDSFLFLLVEAPTAVPFPLVVDIGDRIARGSDASARRVPIYLQLSSAGVEGLDLDDTIEIIVNGAAAAAADGSWGEAGGGVYYYEHTEDEIIDRGYRVLTVDHEDADAYAYGYSVLSDIANAEPVEPPALIPGAVVFGDPEYVDLAENAVNRMCQQFRGDPE